jgi:hypothetical protein
MQFVYEPHIAPKIEQWAESFIAKRRARRRQRGGPIAVPVSSSRGTGGPGRGESLFDGRNWDNSSDSSTLSDVEETDDKVIEMENLVNRDILSWRSGTEGGAKQDGLRHRNMATSAMSSTIDEASTAIPHLPDYILTSHCSRWAVR